MKAFIAKNRWDLCVKNMNIMKLFQLAAVSKIKDKLKEIIICKKKYIEKCCKVLNEENIMIKRLIMISEYISIIEHYINI